MANNKKSSGNKTRDWIIRLAVFGVLGVVLVLALLDYRAKQQATQTATAWTALFDNAKQNQSVLHVEKLQDEIAGSPEVETKDASEATTDLVYTWNGIFRSYEVKVNATSGEGFGNVNTIKGPHKKGEE